MNKYFIGIFGGVLVVVGLGVLIGYQIKPKVEQSLSSVSRTSEYQSLTFMATTTSNYLLRTGSGALGNIVINVLGTGNGVFYDATTTNVNLRTGQVATSSLRTVAVIAASQAAGTYTYDNVFFNGLLAVFNGTQGTSTVMFR